MQNNDSNIRFPGPKFDRFVFTNKLWVKTLQESDFQKKRLK